MSKGEALMAEKGGGGEVGFDLEDYTPQAQHQKHCPLKGKVKAIERQLLVVNGQTCVCLVINGHVGC